jgi:signal transduction histidine kinase
VVTGKITLNTQRVDLADAVRSHVAAMMTSQSVERRVDVVAASAWVLGDPVRVQMIGNRVSNALKFTPPDRLVRVSVYVDGPDAVLRVADEGMGVAPDALPRIFDLFVQGAVATDRSKGGWASDDALTRLSSG